MMRTTATWPRDVVRQGGPPAPWLLHAAAFVAQRMCTGAAGRPDDP